MMIFNMHISQFLFMTFLLSAATAEEQTCTEEGVCFANDEAAKQYYFNGRSVEVEFGDNQQVAGQKWQETLNVIAKTKEYIAQVQVNETLADVRKECKVRNELCSFWAAIGECENNPAYMLLTCAPSCGSCDQLSYDIRCPYDKTAPSVWEKDDLNEMFTRITTEKYYVDKFQPTILNKKPWIVTLENVVTDEQCERLIELGRNRGYERSKDVGERKFDGTFGGVQSEDRTSSNTWCLDECYEDPMTQEVLKTIENITGIPDANSEHLQLLQYEEGQFYHHHHDYIEFHNDRPQGVRIMTVFLYLNDVEEGGGTRFGYLNITVEPKRGRALLWPSVHNHKPTRRDSMTHHEALPVIKGIKYGANSWIHERDFKTPFKNGCD